LNPSVPLPYKDAPFTVIRDDSSNASTPPAHMPPSECPAVMPSMTMSLQCTNFRTFTFRGSTMSLWDSPPFPSAAPRMVRCLIPVRVSPSPFSSDHETPLGRFDSPPSNSASSDFQSERLYTPGASSMTLFDPNAARNARAPDTEKTAPCGTSAFDAPAFDTPAFPPQPIDMTANDNASNTPALDTCLNPHIVTLLWFIIDSTIKYCTFLDCFVASLLAMTSLRA